MPKIIDMAGQRFGHLTVLSRHGTDSPPKWLCRCDCGNDHIANGSNLRRGLITTCAQCTAQRRSNTRKSLQAPCASWIDITGQRFGMLTAVSYDRTKRRWLCQCDCGGTTMASVAELKTRTDCGCVNEPQKIARIKSAVKSGKAHNAALEYIVSGKLRSTNTSGVTGVTVRHNVAMDVYVARITVNGKNIRIGQFATLESAARARKLAEEKYFGAKLDRLSLAGRKDK